GWQVYDQELLEFMAQDAVARQGLLDGLTPECSAWVESRLGELKKLPGFAAPAPLGAPAAEGDSPIVPLARLVLALAAQGGVRRAGRGGGGLPRPRRGRRAGGGGVRSEDVRLVTVGTFPDVSLAYLARGRLEEAGIPSIIANENTGGWLLGMPTGWPKLQVAEGDALRAIAVLESHFGTEEPDEAEEGEHEAPEGAITLRDRFVRFNA